VSDPYSTALGVCQLLLRSLQPYSTAAVQAELLSRQGLTCACEDECQRENQVAIILPESEPPCCRDLTRTPGPSLRRTSQSDTAFSSRLHLATTTLGVCQLVPQQLLL
jgi:hypothetical protein